MRFKPALAAFFFLTIPLLTACEQLDQLLHAEKQLRHISEELASAQERLEEAESQIASLKAEQQSLNFKEMVRGWESIAFLKPGDGGYTVVKFDFGYMTIQIDDVKPYANGSKVRLKFGNPLAATINDLSATLEWGGVDERGRPKNSEASSKKMKFTESIKGGEWTTVSVVLEGVPPGTLGFIRLKEISNGGISLAT